MRLKSVVLPEPFGPISAVMRTALDSERDAVHRLDPAETLLGAAHLEQRPGRRFGSLRRRPLDDAQWLALEAGADLSSGLGLAAPRRDLPHARDDPSRHDEHDEGEERAEEDQPLVRPPDSALRTSG